MIFLVTVVSEKDNGSIMIFGEQRSHIVTMKRAFHPTAETVADQLSPVSAPWVFLKTLRSGYLTAAGEDGELLRLTIDDSYEEDALRLDIWLDPNHQPNHADILYEGRRILSLQVENFQIL